METESDGYEDIIWIYKAQRGEIAGAGRGFSGVHGGKTFERIIYIKKQMTEEKDGFKEKFENQ